MEDEQSLKIQFLLRDELARTKTELPEIEISPEMELDAKILDLDEACLIIQNAERMYQSISRYNHLLDVYQKALDLQAEERKTDPLKAIIKIQAITRGFLTRKKVNELRTLMNVDLGLSAEAWINSIVENKKISFLKNLPIEELHFEKKLPESFFEKIDELEVFIKDNFFVVDPLDGFDDEKQRFTEIDEFTENIFSELFLAEALKIQYDVKKFDDLISQIVPVKKKGKTSHIDLRNFLYAVTVIPFCLQEWNFGKNKNRKNILIFGDPGSGKTAWTSAVSLLADTLAQNQMNQRLQNPPKRLIELSKSTKKLTAGKTIEKVNAKFSVPEKSEL
ncbi:hypothetical protein FO519_003438 [Halicephalobus sp. NKZ332]|nr:hypothetical protein FO519_003438 [Halicephalobus sp. NKZ332]